MIPKILHRCVPEHVPFKFQEFWLQWHEQYYPEWEFRTYRDPWDVNDWPITGHKFKDCLHGAQVAGLQRLEAVYTHGGVYVDMDMKPNGKQKLDDLIKLLPEDSMFVGTEDGTHLTDAMFGAEAGNVCVKAILDRVLAMDMQVGALATGPRNFDEVLWKNPPGTVVVLPPVCFYPYLYTEKCRENEDFSKIKNCIAIHTWNFSWVNLA